MGNKNSTKIEGAVNTERTKPNLIRASILRFGSKFGTSCERSQITKPKLNLEIPKYQIDYKNFHSSSSRGPFGIVSTYNYHQPESLLPRPNPSLLNNDLGKTPSFFDIYDKIHPKSNYDEFVARISSHADKKVADREIERIRNERLAVEERHRINQHVTEPHKYNTLLECIDYNGRIDAQKSNDQKIFPIHRYPELTHEINQVINSASKSYPGEEVLVELDGVQILRKDVQTLIGTNWLNDEIINAYMTLIVQRSQTASYKKAYSFNTFFYPKLRDSGYSSVRRWTRRVDIFSYSFVIIPVHLGNHWCLSFVDFTKRTIAYYDSMGGGPGRCLEIVLNYLREESNDKKKQSFDDENWRLVNSFSEGIPQQFNCSDCGVFACMYAEHLARQVKLDFSQKDMPYFRKKMIYEIVKKKILE